MFPIVGISARGGNIRANFGATIFKYVPDAAGEKESKTRAAVDRAVKERTDNAVKKSRISDWMGGIPADAGSQPPVDLFGEIDAVDSADDAKPQECDEAKYPEESRAVEAVGGGESMRDGKLTADTDPELQLTTDLPQDVIDPRDDVKLPEPRDGVREERIYGDEKLSIGAEE